MWPFALIAVGAWWLVRRQEKALALPSGASSGPSASVANTDGRTVRILPNVTYRFQLLLPQLSEAQRQELAKNLIKAPGVQVTNVEVRPAKAPYLGSTAVVMTYRSASGMAAPKTIGGTLDVGTVQMDRGVTAKPVARIKCIERLDGKPIG